MTEARQGGSSSPTLPDLISPQTHTHTYTHTHIYTFIYLYTIHLHIRTHTHTHTHTHINTHHTHTDTHIQHPHTHTDSHTHTHNTHTKIYSKYTTLTHTHTKPHTQQHMLYASLLHEEALVPRALLLFRCSSPPPEGKAPFCQSGSAAASLICSEAHHDQLVISVDSASLSVSASGRPWPC